MEGADAGLCEARACSDAGEQQQLRRVDRAGGEDDFAPNARLVGLAVPAVADSAGSLALEQDALGEGTGLQRQVRLAPRRLEKSVGR